MRNEWGRLLKTFVERFIPKHYYVEDDVESIRRANALVYLSLLNIAMGCIFVSLDLLRGSYVMATSNFVTTAVMGVLPYWLRSRGSIWWPAQVQVATIFVSLGVLNFVNGGFSQIYLMADVLLPLYAVFLMGARVGLFWSLMVTLKVLGFLLMTKGGILFPKGASAIAPQVSWAAAACTLSFLATGLAALFERLKDEAFRRLKAANVALEEARAEAVGASLAKSEFLANMSHEIRTPLNAIIGYSEILQEDIEDLGEESLNQDLEKICSSSRHLLGLINDILDLSKIEAGKMERYVEPFEFGTWFDGLLSSATTHIHKNNNEFIVSHDKTIDIVRTDPTRLRQVIENLLSNAGKFTKEGKVSLRVTQEERDDERWLCFEIQDTGIGIPVEQQNFLFQKFTQAEASTSKRFGGTGLGLALCKEFCTLLDGHISLDSKPGEGSLFRIEIPADLPYDEQRSYTPISLQSINVNHDNELILLIDDDEACHDMLQRYLNRHGYQVISAYNGEEGIQMALKHRPSAILLDVCMPGIDGWDVLGQLKANPLVTDIPVVLVTIVDEVQKGFTLGASEFLLKPFKQKKLHEVLLRFRKANRDFSVLVVEDDNAIRELVARMLRKEGCTVHEACNGNEALKALESDLPELVITDLIMPELDGFSFLSTIRKDERLASLPVIVMTAKELTQEERDSLDGLVERVLTKDAYHLQDLLENLCLQMKELIDTSSASTTQEDE